MSTNKEVSVWWIQQKLNRIYPNQRIAEDNKLGNETLNLIRRFQKDNGLSPDGIVGPLTYNKLMEKDPLRNAKVNIITEKSNLKSKIDVKSFGDSIIQRWGNAYTNSSMVTTVVGYGVQALIDNNIHVHVNWNRIIKGLLEPVIRIKGGPKEIIHINQKDIYKHGMKSYSFARIGKYLSNYRFKMGCLNIFGDLVIGTQKVWSGQLQIVDIGQYISDGIETVAAYLATQGVSISTKLYRQPITAVMRNVSAQVSGAIAKKVWIPTFARGAAVVGGTVCVVGAEMISAFQIGCFIGDKIEERWHIGETAINYYWDLFLGSWFEKYYEWKVNRVVLLTYPPDWTEEDIKKFHESINKHP